MDGTATVTAVADTTAPTAVFGGIEVGVIGTEQMVSLAFNESVTGLDATSFSTSTGVTGIRVSSSGQSRAVAFTPNAETFRLTLAAD